MRTPLLIVLLLAAAGGGFAGGVLFQKSNSGESAVPAQAGAKLQPPKPEPPGWFHATTKFQIRKSGVPVITSTGTKLPDHDPLWFQSQVGILQSQEIMTRAVKNFKLEEKWRMPQWEAVKKIPGMIEITVEPGTDIICVTGYSDLRSESADLPNAVLDAYQEYRNDLEYDAVGRVKQASKEAIEMQRNQVEKLRTALQESAKKTGVADDATLRPGSTAPAPGASSSEYLAARQEYEHALAMLAALREQTARTKLEAEVVPRLVDVLEHAQPPDPQSQPGPPGPER